MIFSCKRLIFRALAFLLPSLWSVFLITVSTVDGAALRGLEWNFGFLATVRACDLMHLPGATVEIAPSSITHIFHSFSFSYT